MDISLGPGPPVQHLRAPRKLIWHLVAEHWLACTWGYLTPHCLEAVPLLQGQREELPSPPRHLTFPEGFSLQGHPEA